MTQKTVREKIREICCFVYGIKQNEATKKVIINQATDEILKVIDESLPETNKEVAITIAMKMYVSGYNDGLADVKERLGVK